MNKELEYEKLLGIKTAGRDDSKSGTINYPYEPTPYSVLERLSGSGYIGKENHLLDYGCGKGRVDFFLAMQNKCRCTGIDYDTRMWGKAMENREKFRRASLVDFANDNACDFIPEGMDRYYFFNPFSMEVLQKVIPRILDEYYRDPRETLLFFYYPSNEYISYLMTANGLSFLDEIDCRDLFPGNNNREVILVFEVTG